MLLFAADGRRKTSSLLQLQPPNYADALTPDELDTVVLDSRPLYTGSLERRLEDWRTGGLEDWRTGRLSN